jgi:PD-(D/E)XK nuclease superfamily
MTTWSYSSLKTFDQCPKKYYHLRVVKDVKDEGSTATAYGQELHKVAEDYIKVGATIPPKFSFLTPTLQALDNIEGNKHCEIKLGVRKTDTGYESCEFFAKDVWWRGIADLFIEQGDTAYLVDYKTNKNSKYADTKQLDLLAGAIFLHFPDITRIKSGLLFVVSNEFIRKEHDRELAYSYLSVFEKELDRLEAAQQTKVWNAVTGPLCKFCPVHTCEHNKASK